MLGPIREAQLYTNSHGSRHSSLGTLAGGDQGRRFIPDIIPDIIAHGPERPTSVRSRRSYALSRKCGTTWAGTREIIDGRNSLARQGQLLRPSWMKH